MNLKSTKSFRVAKYLLNNVVSSQIDISKETNVAIGYVNEIIHYLDDLNIVKVAYGETILTDYAKLLEKISMDRSLKKIIKSTIRLPTISTSETEEKLKQYCLSNEVDYAFTAFSGLKHFYEYHISYPMVHIYIENSSVMDNLEKGEGAVPVFILESDRPDIMLNSFRVDNTSIVERMQVIIDLYSSGLGRDAAIKYYRDSIWKKESYSQNIPTRNY